MQSDYIDYIEDDGIIEWINAEDNTIGVRINHPDECGECPAAKICGGGKQKNIFTIKVSDTHQYRIGQTITIQGSEKLHRRAIMLATVLPCIALIAVMAIIYLTTGNQATAALGGLITMVLFFGILYLARNKIAHEFVFEISKKHPNNLTE